MNLKMTMCMLAAIAVSLPAAAQETDSYGWLGTETLKTRSGEFEFKGGYPAGDTAARLLYAGRGATARRMNAAPAGPFLRPWSGRKTRAGAAQALLPSAGAVASASSAGAMRLSSSFLYEFTRVETGHIVIGSAG